MSEQLQKRAILVKLRLGQWSGAMHDKEATQEVIHRAHAADKTARVRKQLVNRKRFESATKAYRAMYDYHMAKTLPWDDSGTRLLPIAGHAKYKARMEIFNEDRIEAINEFIDSFDSAIEQAELELGELFHPEDYPDVSELRDKYSADWEFSPVPTGSHFVADLADNEVDRIRQDIERHTTARIEAGVADVYARLGKTIRSLNLYLNEPETEDGKKRRLSDSVWEGFRELTDSVPVLNITDDPGLAKLREEILGIIENVDPNELRPSKKKIYNEATRDSVASGMQGLSEKFAGYFGAGETIEQ